MTSPPTSPARPILASSLLSLEKEKELNRYQLQHQHQHHRNTSFPSLINTLPTSLFTGGKVIGIIDDSDTSSSEPEKLPLISEIICTHLASVHAESNLASNASQEEAAPSPPPSRPTIHIISLPLSTPSPSSSHQNQPNNPLSPLPTNPPPPHLPPLHPPNHHLPPPTR